MVEDLHETQVSRGAGSWGQVGHADHAERGGGDEAVLPRSGRWQRVGQRQM